ncbi:uncharacterized protein LOC128959054 [Oppia nitens]|uniref:uncharacterized protein LOC128959054 n=1 Tax=Oppia nitens TaxID=1686743 RepID=UPI0023DAE33B|nr:uncharacterized protein LOC128959054 [Oppia nitens]
MSACCSCTTGYDKDCIYKIITKQIDAEASEDDFEYKCCNRCYNQIYGFTLLGAAVNGYVRTDKNLNLSLREINTSTNYYTYYSANDLIEWNSNKCRRFEIIVESITIKMSVSTSIAPSNQSVIIMDYCISPKNTKTIGQLKQELANRYGYRMTKLYLTDSSSSRSRRQLLDDMSIENAWFYPNIANSLINVVPNTMSCCDNCLKDVNRQYYCRIDIKQIDPNNNSNSSGDSDFKYLFCRHTGPVRVKDIYYVCVDGYNETDISLEIRNTNQSNDTNQWLNCDQFIDFADYIYYTVEQKRTGSIQFEIRPIQVTVNMSLAGLKQTQKSDANQQSLIIPLNILPTQTPTVGQLKQQLALKYMFETETVSLYLSDMDTNEPQDNRQLTDDQPIAYVWFYGYYSRSVINIVSIKSVKYLTEVINRSNDLILEKMTTLLSMANSGQSVSNQSADVITDAVITANNDLLSAKMTELTTTLSDTIRDCFTEQTKAITDAIISANKYNNNDVITTGKLMACLTNQTKHFINALSVRDKYLADILVDESETNSQWTCNESIVRIDDDINIIDDNQSIDKTIISQTVSESMDNNNNSNNNDTTGVGINDNNIDISNTDSLNQIGSELETINNDDDNDDSQLIDHLLDTEAVVVVADQQQQQQHRDSDRLQELMNAMAEIQMQITILDKKSKNN